MVLPQIRAIDGARTRGLDLGKVARYQLRHYRMEQVMGIEPTYLAWKASILPLNYTCIMIPAAAHLSLCNDKEYYIPFISLCQFFFCFILPFSYILRVFSPLPPERLRYRVRSVWH